jgi:predicted glycoside hydrolase/deacetylase ChbG (UPF0249 family)
MKKFIFNADDLGLSPLTTEGILKCSKIVKSASLMVTSDSAEESFNKAIESGISVGIHLNVSGEGNFINQSGYFGKSGVINKSYKNKERLSVEVLDEIFKEFNAQLNSFKEKFGVEPSHINFHHPLYHIPNFTERFKVFIEKVNLPTRWFRELGDVNVPHPNHTEFRFYTEEELTAENLVKIMNEAPEGITEFVLHPGLLDEQLNSSYVYERLKQFEVLTSEKVSQSIEQNGWGVINFNEFK